MNIREILRLPETRLSEDFTDPGFGITLEAGTTLQTIGFSDTHFQCLIGNRKIVWVPKNKIKTE